MKRVGESPAQGGLNLPKGVKLSKTDGLMRRNVKNVKVLRGLKAQGGLLGAETLTNSETGDREAHMGSTPCYIPREAYMEVYTLLYTQHSLPGVYTV